MERNVGAKDQEVQGDTKRSRQKGILSELKKAIGACRELAQGYTQSHEPSEILLDKLSFLERELLDEFFQAATMTEKAVPRAKKKPEKQAQAALTKVGA